MKSKTSPGKVSITDLDKISNDGIQEGFIAFQLLEMGAPYSSMVNGQKLWSIENIRKLQGGTKYSRATRGYCHVFGQGSC